LNPSGSGCCSYDYATVAYDPRTGHSVWVSRYDDPGHQYDVPASVAVTPDGEGVFVTGQSGGAHTFQDVVTVAYDALTGDQLWEERYDSGLGDDIGDALAVSPNGDMVFAEGRTEWLSGIYTVLAYDASTGEALWKEDSDFGGAMAVSSDGARVVVAGSFLGGHFSVLGYNALTGHVAWSHDFSDPEGLAEATTVVPAAPTAGGGSDLVFVGGYARRRPSENYHYIAAAFQR